MNASDFKRMVDRCNEVYNPKDAYVCVSWRDDEYHPIHCLDGTLVIVGTEKLTNSKYCGPTQFFIRANAYRENSFYGKTMRWVDFARIATDGERDIKFLIATTDEYPQNIIGEINPHRTSMIENSDGTNIIVLRWDNRDDGDTPKNSAPMTFDGFKSFIVEPDTPLNYDSCKCNESPMEMCQKIEEASKLTKGSDMVFR